MDVVRGVKQYVSRMIAEAGTGMKVLIMDKETISIVSMVYSQSDILQKEVYNFELLSNTGREAMKHLSAICIIRPTIENIDLLCTELKTPKYGSYFIYFTNRIDRGSIEKLALCDDQESVREVKEYYADYLAVGQHLFSFNIDHLTTSGLEYKRVCDGIVAALLSLKKKPYIRYTHSSRVSQRLADDLYRSINHRQERELFDFRSDVPPLLLILDRKDDPVTPLLNQWSYQAMVHEVFGIQNHRVDLSRAPGITKELQEIVLSPESDEFFRENMYLNFGDIGANIKTMVDSFQEKQKSHAKIESIADMKAFVENYPQFRKLSGTVAKHVAVVSELSRIVAEHHLMAVSETEQDIVTQSEKSNHYKNVESLIKNSAVRSVDCLRLVLLIVLRYEGQLKRSEIDHLVKLLRMREIPDQKLDLVDAIMESYREEKRTSKLFESSNPLTMKKFLRGLKGVENVYTRHKPYLVDVLENLMKGKLRESQYPFMGDPLGDKPQDVIVFIVGGATYAEAFAVAQMNSSNQGMRIVLGSNTILNSESFMTEILKSSPRESARERFRQLPPV
ncbi:PREDICTED: vacuolar protein sorting-associated protein 45-like [Amphimedon queenslandica]|nr:PREDICTED: vacuolar protein sorting-associated protein 45-like [Amphimedon queenslandica]|eukprot:XP_003382629.1 PREDICTED: vacuolar protein sorting-associated protein 45-like [Amphimedon queenslandica]